MVMQRKSVNRCSLELVLPLGFALPEYQTCDPLNRH